MLTPSVIVCGLDGTPASVELARISSSLAVELGARLELVHVLEAPPRAAVTSRPGGGDGMTAAQAPATTALEALAMLDGLADASEAQAVGRHVIPFGEPAQRIAAIAEERDAWLIVVGAHGTAGGRGARIGSVASRLAADAPCPVLVIPAGFEQHVRPSTWRNRTIVCGFDGSPASISATMHAAVLAAWLGGSLDLVTVDATYPPGKANIVERIFRALDLSGAYTHGQRGLAVNQQLRAGEPAWELARVAATTTAPLIAVGARGIGPWDDQLLGSVAQVVLLAAHRAILVAPATGFEAVFEDRAVPAVERATSMEDAYAPRLVESAR